MSVFDTVIVVPERSADDKTTIAAHQVVAVMVDTLKNLEGRCRQICNRVAEGGGKDAIAAELGADGAEFQTIYSELKTFIASHSDIVVEDL